MVPQVFTFADAVNDLEEFCREASLPVSSRSIRSAVRRAYREITAAREWSCLKANYRIFLKAYQETGTVTYDHTGGAYERMLTLVGSTWPTDVIDWAVRIEGSESWVVCDVEARKSSTVITLDATMNPGEDIAAGASYVCYPRYYRLPSDYVSTDAPLEEALVSLGKYVTPQRMLELDRYNNESGDIKYFTIAPVPDLYGAMGLFVYPYADSDRTLDILYRRKPRELRYVGTELSDAPGTITISSGDDEVAGTDTTFASTHVGSLLRIGDSSTRVPTGLDGLHPYVEQRTIYEYTSATAVTLDGNVSAAATGVKYAITDPIDLDDYVYDAMIAAAKANLAIEKRMKEWQAVAAVADQTLYRAKCADNKVTTRRVAGVRVIHEPRLSDSPTANRYEVS